MSEQAKRLLELTYEYVDAVEQQKAADAYGQQSDRRPLDEIAADYDDALRATQL